MQISAECLYVVSSLNLTGESKDCSNSLFKALFQVRKSCAVIEYVADDCMVWLILFYMRFLETINLKTRNSNFIISFPEC